jgi:hypothetical protein
VDPRKTRKLKISGFSGFIAKRNGFSYQQTYKLENKAKRFFLQRFQNFGFEVLINLKIYFI